MYDFHLHQKINTLLKDETDIAGKDNLFYTRFIANASAIQRLYTELYAHDARATAAPACKRSPPPPGGSAKPGRQGCNCGLWQPGTRRP